jgi:hypothetical protein
VTAPERTLARVRSVLPESWDPRLSDPESDKRRLLTIQVLLYPKAKDRARIVALVEQHGALRMTQIRDMLALKGGSASGHLTALVQMGRLERAGRGIYHLPGKRPAVLPPHPYQDRTRRRRPVAARTRTGGLW